MNRKLKIYAPIDLGAVSARTRGLPWGMDDFQGGRYIGAGLARD